jgi:hypothetical protein
MYQSIEVVGCESPVFKWFHFARDSQPPYRHCGEGAMLTRSQARATNQHVFVDDKWNDAYIQTKDEQIDMLHAQRVLKSWEDEADSEADAEEAEPDEDRWVSDGSDDEDDEDEGEENDDAKKRAEEEAQRRRRGGRVLAGGGFLENVVWTVMAATVAPVVLYAMAARVGLVGRRRAWPLESTSFTGTLVKAYANVATIAILLGVAVGGVCGDMALPLSLSQLRWRSIARVARRIDTCASDFTADWTHTATPSKLALMLLNRETQQLVARTLVVLVVAWLLTQFYRLWLKAVVLLSALAVASVRVAAHLRAEQRSAIEIVSLDPNFAFANESIFVRGSLLR